MRRPSPDADLCPGALCPTRPRPSMPALIYVSLVATHREPVRSLTLVGNNWRFRHAAAASRRRNRGREGERGRRAGTKSDASDDMGEGRREQEGLGPGLWGVNLRHGTSAALVDLRLLESDCKGSAICATHGMGTCRESRARESKRTEPSRSEQRGRSSRAMCSNLLLMEIMPPPHLESGSPVRHNQSSERCEDNLHLASTRLVSQDRVRIEPRQRD